MTTEPTLDLARLGDALEHAAGAQLAQQRRTRRMRLAIPLAAGALLLTASAAAAGLFSPAQVAAGLPAGAVIFGAASPTCSLDTDRATYHCTLDSAPVSDEGPAGAQPAKGGVATGSLDYTGTKEPIVIDGAIAGGCIGRSADGLAWDCYVGEDAVTHEIISEDFLGEPAGPGHG